MAPSADDVRQPPSHRSPQARDRGLRRSRRVTGWIAVSAVTGTATLAGLYTHLLPGGSATTVPPGHPVQNPSASAAGAPAAGELGNGYIEWSGHEGDDDGDDEGAGPFRQPAPRAPVAPQLPAQPPAATLQLPHTTTGAS